MDLKQILAILRGVAGRGIGVPIALVMILAMMVLPLPALALDVLFTFNITLSLIIILAVVYVSRPLEFGVFPTVLLVATLLRLALNVASTRVVLLNGHEGPDAAGKVIEAFDQVHNALSAAPNFFHHSILAAPSYSIFCLPCRVSVGQVE